MKYNLKELQDLTFLYIAFSYIDTDLRNNGWVVSINGINELSLKAKENEDFKIIQKTYQLVKSLNMLLTNNGIVFGSKKGDLLAKIAGDVIYRVFNKINNEILASYLGFVALFKYSEYKFKKLKFMFDENFIIYYINEVNDKYWSKDNEITPAIDNSEKAVDEMFRIIYTTSFVGKRLRNLKIMN